MVLVALVRAHLAEAHLHVVGSLIETFVEALMGAEVHAICGGAYHQPRAHTSAHTASQPSYARRGLAPPELKDPKAS
jgi:transposase-like protein